MSVQTPLQSVKPAAQASASASFPIGASVPASKLPSQMPLTQVSPLPQSVSVVQPPCVASTPASCPVTTTPHSPSTHASPLGQSESLAQPAAHVPQSSGHEEHDSPLSHVPFPQLLASTPVVLPTQTLALHASPEGQSESLLQPTPPSGPPVTAPKSVKPEA